MPAICNADMYVTASLDATQVVPHTTLTIASAINALILDSFFCTFLYAKIIPFIVSDEIRRLTLRNLLKI